MSNLTEIAPQIWESVIRQRVPAKALELNVRAFWRGRDALVGSHLTGITNGGVTT
jgi:hypothetical protein